MEEFYEIIERKKKILGIEEKYKKIYTKLIFIFKAISFIVLILFVNEIIKIEIVKTTCDIISIKITEVLNIKYVDSFTIISDNITIQVPVGFTELKLEDLGSNINCTKIKYYGNFGTVIGKVKYNIEIGEEILKTIIKRIFNIFFIIICIWFCICIVTTIYYNKEKKEIELTV